MAAIWDYGALVGSGGLCSTITDMLAFATANLDPVAGRYAGVYQLDPHGAVTVTRTDGGLVAEATGLGMAPGRAHVSA